jgi:hypothetical protein
VENKFYIKELDSYKKASDKSKKRMGTDPKYDLELLPSEQMQNEIRDFLLDRSKKIGAEKIYTQRRFYHHLCHMLQKQRNKPESFLDWDKTKWIQQMKIWLMKQGLPLTESYKKTNGGKGIVQAKTLLYVEHLIDYLVRLKETDVNEIAKDIWGIEKLDIEVKQDLTRVTKIINFKEILQPDLKEEIKKAVYGLVKNLRKKIEENPEEPYYIETIRGVGYRFRA